MKKKLPTEVNKCQIIATDSKLDSNIKDALNMLIKVLKTKKNYILENNQIEENGKKKTYDEIKNNIMTFKSSQYCLINLTNIEPKNIKLFEIIKIINDAIFKSMILLDYDLCSIEEYIKDNKYNINIEEFLKNINTFTSNATLALIHKKNKKYFEFFQILKSYINNNEKKEESQIAANLIKEILFDLEKTNERVKLLDNTIL